MRVIQNSHVAAYIDTTNEFIRQTANEYMIWHKNVEGASNPLAAAFAERQKDDIKEKINKLIGLYFQAVYTDEFYEHCNIIRPKSILEED